MKFLSIISICLILSSYGFSQEIKETSNKKSPVITFEKVLNDYGDIQYEGNGVCEFVYKNTGKEPLILVNVQASCGCTIPEWSKEPLKKGHKAVIKVKYDTKKVGQFHKTIAVISNAKNSNEQLTIKGNVLSEEGGEKLKIEEKTLPVQKGYVKKNKQSRIIEEDRSNDE